MLCRSVDMDAGWWIREPFADMQDDCNDPRDNFYDIMILQNH